MYGGAVYLRAKRSSFLAFSSELSPEQPKSMVKATGLSRLVSSSCTINIRMKITMRCFDVVIMMMIAMMMVMIDMKMMLATSATSAIQ